jgi:hypothetical protein
MVEHCQIIKPPLKKRVDQMTTPKSRTFPDTDDVCEDGYEAGDEAWHCSDMRPHALQAASTKQTFGFEAGKSTRKHHWMHTCSLRTSSALVATSVVNGLTAASGCAAVTATAKVQSEDQHGATSQVPLQATVTLLLLLMTFILDSSN